MKPGELVYADATIRYKFKGRQVTKLMPKSIISRKYEGNWPKLDNKEDSLIIGKLVKDRVNTQFVEEVEGVGLKVLARTGFINRRDNNYKPTQGFRVEKSERQSNGSFV